MPLCVNLLPEPLPFAEAKRTALMADADAYKAYSEALSEYNKLIQMRKRAGQQDVPGFAEAKARRAATELRALKAVPSKHYEYCAALSVRNKAAYKRKPWYTGSEQQKADMRKAWADMRSDPTRSQKRRDAALKRYHARFMSDDAYVIENRIRARIRECVRKGAATKTDKHGIDYQAIADHLGPCPGNLADYHIDHIVPIAAFDLRDPKQLLEAFAPSNHQWLTAEENLRKSAKVDV